jgi:uncharacterized protein (DUF2384 family)
LNSANLVERLDSAASTVRLDRDQVARVLSTDVATFESWMRNSDVPHDAERQRLHELLAVLERLSTVLKPDAAHAWLFAPNPLLDRRAPVDLMRSGDTRKVLGAIDAFAEGVFV